MKARRLVSVAALVVTFCVSAPAVFAGDMQNPWGTPTTDTSSTTLLLDAAITGVDAALTVL